MGAVRVNTLGNLLVELEAGRSRLTARPPARYLAGEHWFMFCAERRKSLQLDTKLASLSHNRRTFQLADLIMKREAALLNREYGKKYSLEEAIRDDLAKFLPLDINADIQRWPMTQYR